jgi:hypothetical protein
MLLAINAAPKRAKTVLFIDFSMLAGDLCPDAFQTWEAGVTAL